MSAILEQHLNSLREHTGHIVDYVEADGLSNIIVKNHPLPVGYTKASSDILMRLDAAYPLSKPDMFWLEADILLAGGTIPKNAEEILNALGRKWRRFSWHFNSWNPATGDLLFFLEFIKVRINKVE